MYSCFAKHFTRLVWHRLQLPYIPSLKTIHRAIHASKASKFHPSSSDLLLALLSSLALEVPYGLLEQYRHLRQQLRDMISSNGQVMIFSLPRHPYTLLALQLIAEYRPTAISASPQGASQSIKGDLYAVLAKQVACQLMLDKTTNSLKAQIGTGDLVAQDLLNCVQWCQVLQLELELESYTEKSGKRCSGSRRSFEDSLSVLDQVFSMGLLPKEVLPIYFSLEIWWRGRCAFQQSTVYWRSLPSLGQIIDNHEVESKETKERFETAIQSMFEQKSQCEAASVISQLLDSRLHWEHAGVNGWSLFYGIMSAAHPPSTPENDGIHPEKAIQISDHIIDQLISHSKEDPNRPPIRVFLEVYGDDRTNQCEKILTNFINASYTLQLNGVPFVAPTRHIVAEILFTCKLLAETNAAKYKGWNGLDDRVDTHLILFQEAARRLEAMENTDSKDQYDAISKGSLLAVVARLIRSLHRIILGWKKALADASRQRNIDKAGSSKSNHSFSNNPAKQSGKSSPMTSTESTATIPVAFAAPLHASSDGYHAENISSFDNIPPPSLADMDDWLSGDFFADWSNWPQHDACDLSQLLGDGTCEWEML
jgi:hypothetical protein